MNERKTENIIRNHFNGYLDQIIERDIYLKKKAQMLSEKKTLEEKISDVEKKL